MKNNGWTCSKPSSEMRQPNTFFNWSLPNRSTSFKQMLTHVIAKVLQKGDLLDNIKDKFGFGNHNLIHYTFL